METSETRMRQALEALRGPVRKEGAAPEAAARPARRDHGRDHMRDSGPQIAPRGRHRFVKDGEVPVVHLAANRPREAQVANRPDDEALHAMEELRQRANAAERAQREAMAQLQALQTKLVHQQMALDAATDLAERRQQENDALRQQLEEAAAPRAPAKAKAALEPEDAAEPMEDEDSDLVFIQADPELVPRRRGRPPKPVTASAEPEEEPVQWWLEPTAAGRRRR